MSSHILADVQEVCDIVGILRAGRLLFQGPLETLLVGRAVPAYRVHLRPPIDPVARCLRAEAWITEVQPLGGDWLRVGVRSLDEAERLLAKALAGCGAAVVSMAPQAVDLENVFLELTS